MNAFNIDRTLYPVEIHEVKTHYLTAEQIRAYIARVNFAPHLQEVELNKFDIWLREGRDPITFLGERVGDSIRVRKEKEATK